MNPRRDAEIKLPVQKLCALFNIKFCIRSFKAENKFCMTVIRNENVR